MEFIPYVTRAGDPPRPAQSVHVSATWLDTHETNGAISWTPCRRVNWAATDTGWSANLPALLLQIFFKGQALKELAQIEKYCLLHTQHIANSLLLGL